MTINFHDYIISDDKALMQADVAYELISKTYWGKTRTNDIVKTSIENSLCFGVYKDHVMIGFARCVTDYAVLYYLCDVVINENYRGQGLGKALIKAVTEHEKLAHLLALLDTNDAHGLYRQFGFEDSLATAMRRNRQPPA